MDQLCGAIIDLAETEHYCLALAARGVEPFFANATAKADADFDGWCERKWREKGYEFLWDAEVQLFGRMLPSWIQTVGVCVGEGGGRAFQDSLYWSLVYGDMRGKPVSVAWEPAYAISRVQVGKNQIRGKYGSCGVWMATALHDYGTVARGVFGTVDLSRQREDLATTWSQKGGSVPQTILAESANYKAEAAMLCQTPKDVRNALLAGYGVFRCADRATRPTRDADGFSGTQSSGGHCQEIRGVYRDVKGRTRYNEQQSWPPGAAPHGGGPLKLYNGEVREHPEGCGAIGEDDVGYYCQRGEVWAISPPRMSFNGVSPSEVSE